MGAQARAHPVVGHRHDAARDPEPAAEIRRDGGQAFARRQPPRTLDMGGEIAVAELEPGLAAERAQCCHEVPRLVAPAPAAFGVVETGEHVHQRIDVGRDRQPKMLEVVARVGDHHEFAGAQHAAQAERELGAADTAGERHDTGSFRRHQRNRSSAAARTRLAAGVASPDHVKPRTRTAGCASLDSPMSSDAAAAISSAKPVCVTRRSRP